MNSLLQIVLSNLVLAAAMALVVAIVTRLWRNRHAAHLLWMLVLIKLVTPPLWNVPLAIGDAFEKRQFDEVETDRPVTRSTDAAIEPIQVTSALPPVDASSIAIEPSTSAQSAQHVTEAEPSTSVEVAPTRVAAATEITAATARPIDWYRLLLGAWLATSLLWLLVVVFRILRFHRLVRRSPEADVSLKLQVERLAHRLGLRASPTVRVLDGNISPMVWPLTWKRSLLLPRKLLDELTPSQLDTVIAHELAHLVRRDDLVRFLEAGVTCLFWWNPVVWWARRELRQAEEDCCDALVVCALPESRRQYGEALLRAAEIVTFGRSLPALASAFAQQRYLKRRIEMILMQDFSRGLSWPFKLLLLAVAAAILPLAATAVSQDEPGTAENTTADPEASQFGVQATTAEDTLRSSSPPSGNSIGTQSSESAAAADSSVIGRSTFAANTTPDFPIIALPGHALPIGGFAWQQPNTLVVDVANVTQWTFLDLETGNRTDLSDATETRDPGFEEQGYDIRLRCWQNQDNGRTEFDAVLRNLAYCELTDGLNRLSTDDLLQVVQEPMQTGAIEQGFGVFRTQNGNLGVLEFAINNEGERILKYELIARVADPLPADRSDSTLSETSSIPRSVPTESSVSSSDAQTPAYQNIAVDDPVPAFQNDPSYEPAALTPSTESASTTDWPTQRAGDANNSAQSISTDPDVQQLELELLNLDIESIQIQLDGEQKKLDYVQRLFEQGVGPEGEYQAQQVAVHLLQIELRRASIRRELYETQIQRQQGAGTDGNTVPQQNTPTTGGSGRVGHPQRYGRNTVPQPSTPSNVPDPTIDAGEPTETFDPEYQVPRLPDPDQLGNDPNANRVSTLPEEASFPRAVDPEGPQAIVRGVIVEQGKPRANQVIWIIGEKDGETVLYQDGPSREDGTFEFSDVPVGRPWRVFIPYENGPWGFDSGEMITLEDNSEVAIEVVVAGDTVTVSLIEDATTTDNIPR